MDYIPVTYPCPKCSSNKVAQDPVCAERNKPLMLHFFCCDCHHQWDIPYEPPKDETVKKEATTMQVSYNGFTGELDKLEREYRPSIGIVYNLSIYDSEKNVTYSFTGVKLKDVNFSGGAVTFAE